MINQHPLSLFQSFEQGRFVKPIYQDYSFGNIAPTIYYLLTGKKIGSLLPRDCFAGSYPKPKKVVLFFIDAFGYHFWEKYAKTFQPIMRIIKEGTVTPISALFPSTTAASVTSINLGVLPSQHALVEWFLYIKEYDAVIQTLRFAPLGSKISDACLELGYDPSYLFVKQPTIYKRLNQEHIPSFQFLHRGMSNRAYNPFAGGEKMPFATLADAFVSIKNKLQEQKKGYFYFYWPDIDTISHIYGPYSEEFEAEVANFWLTFDHVFSNYKKPDDTLFIFTADHGQLRVDPKNTYYLNIEIPEMTTYLQVGRNGKTIYPCGSPRDVLLHIKREFLNKTFDVLTQKLKGIAKVLRIDDALKLGLFGNPPYSPVFLERLGQILILPYKDHYVWWYEKDKLGVQYYGYHGGLTKEEMMTTFAVW